jgi:hypothetical protein
VDAVADQLATTLRQEGFRVRRRRGTGRATIEAHRGWLGTLGRVWWPLGRLTGLGRLGSQVVHLGVLLVGIGGYASGYMSCRHCQFLRRGEAVAVPDLSHRLAVGYQLGRMGHDLLGLLGVDSERELSAADRAAAAFDWREGAGNAPPDPAFRLRLRRFEYVQDARGMKEYFGAHVTLLDTEPPIQQTIEVNRPLVYGGYHVYQQDFDADYRGLTSVTLIVADVERAEVAEAHSHHAAPITGVRKEARVVLPAEGRVDVPGMDVSLEVVRYFPHWQIPLERGPDGGETKTRLAASRDEERDLLLVPLERKLDPNEPLAVEVEYAQMHGRLGLGGRIALAAPRGDVPGTFARCQCAIYGCLCS